MKILTPVLVLFTLLVLCACSKPEIKIPDVKRTLNNYHLLLSSGNLKQFEAHYFIPLHWRNKEKLYKHFEQLHHLYSSGQLTIQIKKHRQSGRWAVVVLETRLRGKSAVEPLWLFFYDGHWQVIDRVIFHTSTVRAMMNTYPQQENLRQWFLKQQALLISKFRS